MTDKAGDETLDEIFEKHSEDARERREMFRRNLRQLPWNAAAVALGILLACWIWAAIRVALGVE